MATGIGTRTSRQRDWRSIRRTRLLWPAILVVVAWEAEPHTGGGNHVIVVEAAVAAVIAAWILTVARAGVVPHVALAVTTLALTAVALQGVSEVAVVATAITIGRLDLRVGAVLAGVFGAAYTVVLVATQSHLQPVDVGLQLLGLAAVYVASASFTRLRFEHARAEELLAELQASREGQVEAAKTEERGRIAREIHDVLSHTLSGLAIQLESAQLLLDNREDAAARASVAQAQRLAKEGLKEARRAVSALRGDVLPGPEMLKLLAGDFEHTSRIPCRFDVEGTSRELPSEGRLAVYRTAQEALTNVVKHCPTVTSVDIHLRYRVYMSL